MTDQPLSPEPAQEPGGDQPAALVPDEVPAAASAPPAASTPPAAFAPADAPAPPAPAPPPPPAELPSGEGDPAGIAAAFPADRPERAVGAAFAGGLVLALILKRLAR